MHWEVGRAKDLSAPRYCASRSYPCLAGPLSFDDHK